MTASGRSRRANTGLWIALVLACSLQTIEIRFRGIDPDEFEHLHAAYEVYRGQVPYRDFFEHHGPLLYYAVQPAFWIGGPEISALWWGRFAMWCCSLGILALTASVTTKIAGSQLGLPAATLLAWTSIFHAKGIELRPDVPAALLLMAGVVLVLAPAADWRRWLAAGVLCGLATLFTQKSIVLAAGLALAVCVQEVVARRHRQWLLPIAAFSIGGLFSWCLAVAAFSAQGAASEFVQRTIVQLVTWPVRSGRWEHLRPTLAADLTVWAAAIAAIVGALARRQTANRGEGGRFIAVAGLFCIASITWTKATYPQFYFLWMPLLASLAAQELAAWSDRLDEGNGIFWLRAAGCALLALQFELLRRAILPGRTGALPHLAAEVTRSGSHLLVLGIAAAAAVAVGLWLLSTRRSRAVVAAVAVSGMFHAILRNVDAALWSNRDQVVAVALVNRSVGENETVFGGFTGYAALRQHAYYYWWINEYSLALMSPEEQNERLLAELQNAPPAAMVFDSYLDLLPGPVTDWLRENYAPDDSAPWLWLYTPK